MALSAKVKVKMDTKKLNKLLRKTRQQKDQAAEVGHFDGKEHTTDTLLPTAAGTTIASISLINQQGIGNIPPRPYMEVAYRSMVFKKAMLEAAKQVSLGESTPRKQIFHLARSLRDAMKNAIETSDSWAIANSPATVARKSSGGLSTQPLIETEEMLDDIDFRLKR